MGCRHSSPEPAIAARIGLEGSYMREHSTCMELDKLDRGIRLTVFVGKHHKAYDRILTV